MAPKPVGGCGKLEGRGRPPPVTCCRPREGRPPLSRRAGAVATSRPGPGRRRGGAERPLFPARAPTLGSQARVPAPPRPLPGDPRRPGRGRLAPAAHSLISYGILVHLLPRRARREPLAGRAAKGPRRGQSRGQRGRRRRACRARRGRSKAGLRGDSRCPARCRCDAEPGSAAPARLAPSFDHI